MVIPPFKSGFTYKLEGFPDNLWDDEYEAAKQTAVDAKPKQEDTVFSTGGSGGH